MTISVVITCYNQGHFLEECLESVRAQTRRPEQVIVVDDGSTDDTAQTATCWSRQNAFPLRLVRQANAGSASARNTGLRHAQGEFIALLDADDLFLPHHLERLSAAFAQQQDLAVCFGDAEVVEAGAIVRASFLADKAIAALPFDEGPGPLRRLHANVYESLLPGSYIPVCCALFRRQLGARLGGFGETLRFREDADFWLRMSLSGPFAYLPFPLARIRRHDGNKSNPRNASHYLPQKVALLRKLMRHGHQWGITSKELAATRRAAAALAPDLLYAASRLGLGEYARVLATVMRTAPCFPALQPRHFLRAVCCSLAAQRKRPYWLRRRTEEI